MLIYCKEVPCAVNLKHIVAIYVGGKYILADMDYAGREDPDAPAIVELGAFATHEDAVRSFETLMMEIDAGESNVVRVGESNMVLPF